MHIIWQGSVSFSDCFMIQELENLRSWCLLKQNSSSEIEEAVFTVQGIMLFKDLPPIYNKPRRVLQPPKI